MHNVQRAFKNGTVALHPSSSTIFIVEELMGRLPDTEFWVAGIIVPKGACRSAESARFRRTEESQRRWPGPAGFPHTWLIETGELKCGVPLGGILENMGRHDVYIKGVNVIDPNNKAGVLIGNPVEGGTIGLVLSRAKQKGFELVLPVGLEKQLAVPLETAAQAAAQRNLLDYSMGMPCALLPCEGTVVTEVTAVKLLTGAAAIPISAGGLGGAEGALTMVIKGTSEQVTKAIEHVERVKGTQLPREVRAADCRECEDERCSLRGGGKPWC